MSSEGQGAATSPKMHGPHPHRLGTGAESQFTRFSPVVHVLLRLLRSVAATAVLVGGCILSVSIQRIGTPGASLSAAAAMVAAITLTAWVLSIGRPS